jgi:hypothetical protein
VIEWLQRLWWKRQRAIDVAILWPAMKREARDDLDIAHQGFMVHAVMCPCWRREYGDKLWAEVQKLR